MSGFLGGEVATDGLRQKQNGRRRWRRRRRRWRRWRRRRRWRRWRVKIAGVVERKAVFSREPGMEGSFAGLGNILVR